MPESWSPQELVAAGWSVSDLDWEELSQGALTALAAGDRGGAREVCGRALRLAREAFAADDLRLATSLVNQAAASAEAGSPDRAGRMLDEAARIWAASDAWIDRMRPPRTARSSLFHLRMEQRHRATYEERRRAEWHALAAEARECVREAPTALASQAEADERLARWRRECPPTLDDTRKLTAAVILVAVGTGAGEG